MMRRSRTSMVAFPADFGAVMNHMGNGYDLIFVQGIEAFGYHGVFPHERENGQIFRVDLQVWLDLRNASYTDELENSLSYAVLAEQVTTIIKGPAFNLVETLAENIAYAVLKHSGVRVVDVAVHKPHAPIDATVRDVGVCIRRYSDLLRSPSQLVNSTIGTGLVVVPQKATVVVSLGSNLGKRKQNIKKALCAMTQVPEVEIVKVSQIVQTKALVMPGTPEQRDYYNAVAILETTLSPLALLEQLQMIEAKVGRVRQERWEPRVLDLDIIDYRVADKSLVITDNALTIPHPQATQRSFVLQPWASIEPNALLQEKTVEFWLLQLNTAHANQPPRAPMPQVPMWLESIQQ